jgi:hypothetical protein
MDTITHAGASGILLEVKWLSLWIFLDLCGVRESSKSVNVLFNGVDLLGVFSSPRGVAETFDGVCATPDCLVGVVGAEPERDGVPGAEEFTVRFGVNILGAMDRSRRVYSFL